MNVFGAHCPAADNIASYDIADEIIDHVVNDISKIIDDDTVCNLTNTSDRKINRSSATGNYFDYQSYNDND